MSTEVATLMLEYLLSDRGAYLRGPLVEDVADIVDQLGLATQFFLSLFSNQLLPPPAQKPDRAKVLQILNLANGLLTARLDKLPTSRESRTSQLRILQPVLRWLLLRTALQGTAIGM